MKRQRMTVNANGRPTAARDAGRHKGDDRPVVVGSDLPAIALHELGHGVGHFGGDRVPHQADDFQRTPQALHVLVKTEHLPAKGPQPFGDCGPEQKADVIDRNMQLGAADPFAVHVRPR